MKKSVKILSLFLIIVCLLTSCACNGRKDNGDDTSTTTPDGGTVTPGGDTAGVTDSSDPSDTSVTKPGTDGIVIASNGKNYYTVVRSSYCSNMLKEKTVRFMKTIENTTGSRMSISDDWQKGIGRDDVVVNDKKEILIGETNRKETKDVLNSLPDESYAIKAVNNKIVIVGYDDYSTVAAVSEFSKLFLINNTKELVIPSDTDIVKKSPVQKIPLESGSDLRIMTFNVLGGGGDVTKRITKESTLILDYLPDVIGFQEVNGYQHINVLSCKDISKHYEINMKYHEKSTIYNYTPILYRKDKYSQIEAGCDWLRSRYTETNTKSVSWTVLSRKEDNKIFMVINMHASLWLSNYKPPAGETQASMKEKARVQWKVDNAKQMLEIISSVRAKYGDIPVFTTGDYNFNSTHPAYKTMKSTGLESAQEKATVSSSKGGSYHNDVGLRPSSTGLAIDHVFYDPDFATPFVYKICTREIDLYASDHCPVYADFKLK